MNISIEYTLNMLIHEIHMMISKSSTGLNIEDPFDTNGYHTLEIIYHHPHMSTLYVRDLIFYHLPPLITFSEVIIITHL